MKYCAKCGNSGFLLPDNRPCDCRLNVENFFSTVVCLDIPEQYQGMVFTPSLISLEMGDAYRNFMTSLHESIVSMKYRHKNMVICSPAATSKSVLAYCTIQELFRRDVETFPLYDIHEIKRILTDMDFNRKQTYDVKDPEKLLTVPYLFVRIPTYLTTETYDIIAMLLDRRVRRGNSTIFLYNGSWESMTRLDNMKIMASLLGDGSYGTIENKTWWKIQGV